MKKVILTVFICIGMVAPSWAQHPYGVTPENTFISLEQAEVNPAEVICLNLRGKGLTEIPTEISHYPNMRVLTLMKNNISEAAPVLFSPPALKDLNIRNNSIRNFPVDLLQQWDSLEVLNMAYNKFTALPAELGAVSTLKVLQADHNQIDFIAPELASLEQLEFLILSDNQLDELGGWVTGMKSLRELDLSYNKIAAVDRLQGFYPDLVTLNLSNNRITTLSLNFKGLPGLKTLALNSNQLTALPEELSTLTSLEILILSDNPLQRLPKKIGKLKNLKTLIALQTQLSDQEKARIRKALPGCDIRFE